MWASTVGAAAATEARCRGALAERSCTAISSCHPYPKQLQRALKSHTEGKHNGSMNAGQPQSAGNFLMSWLPGWHSGHCRLSRRWDTGIEPAKECSRDEKIWLEVWQWLDGWADGCMKLGSGWCGDDGLWAGWGASWRQSRNTGSVEKATGDAGGLMRSAEATSAAVSLREGRVRGRAARRCALEAADAPQRLAAEAALPTLQRPPPRALGAGGG